MSKQLIVGEDNVDLLGLLERLLRCCNSENLCPLTEKAILRNSIPKAINILAMEINLISKSMNDVQKSLKDIYEITKREGYQSIIDIFEKDYHFPSFK